MGVKSTDFWHKLNATRQTKCKSLAYIAFNLPIVAFTLSGDQKYNHPIAQKLMSMIILHP